MKRLLVLVLFILSSAFLVPKTPVYAQSNIINSILNWKFPTAQQTNQAIYGTQSINAESTVHFQNTNNAYDIADMIDKSVCLAGAKSQNETATCLQNSTTMKIGGIIADMYANKPADTGLFLADMGHSLGFVPDKVYAQGIGFTGMEPLLPIWKAFRNIAYLLMALIMIILGFMIMFRKKIDPKTVVTAQNAIPRVVIALILITFSYAIVGFMIDIMYLLLFFIIAIFKSTGYLPDPSWYAQNIFHYKTNDALYSQGGILANMSNVDMNPLRFLGWNVNSNLEAGIGAASTVVAIIGGVMALAAVPAGAVVGLIGIGLPLVHLILAIAVLFLFIRLLAFFLTSYIQIIISLLLGPLQLLFEAIPGTNSFSSWIKNLAANLVVFPVGGAMFMLSAVFSNFSSGNISTGSTTLWMPPYTGIVANTTAIGAIISLGILFAIPSVAGSIKEALKAKPLMSMGGGGGAGGSVMQMLSTAYYLKMLAPGQLTERIFGKQGGEEHG